MRPLATKGRKDGVLATWEKGKGIKGSLFLKI